MGKRVKGHDYYVENMIKLRANLIRNFSDYGDSVKVRKHNRSNKKLYGLFDELYDEVELASQVYSTLMKNEDPDIRQYGATCSLIMRINVEEAVPVLEWCVENREVPYSGGARRRLMMFCGQIPEDTPRRPPKWRNEE